VSAVLSMRREFETLSLGRITMRRCSGWTHRLSSVLTRGRQKPRVVRSGDELKKGMQPRILIADDDAAIRKMIRKLVESSGEWQVVGEAVDGADAVAKSAELTPDLVVLDLAMPNMSGLDAGHEINKRFQGIHLLLLTLHEITPQLVSAASQAGFQGALSKAMSMQLATGIKTILAEEQFFRLSPTPKY
jgi:CheY-like chemotaxis protein